MNNETIALIVGFGIGAFTVAIFATIIIILLLKRATRNDSLNGNIYNTNQMKKLLAKYCAADTYATKGVIEHHTQHYTFENGEYKIFRPKKFITSFMPPKLLSLLGDTAPYLFGVETFCKASSKTTESIIEYIDTVKRFVRSNTFTSLATPEKQYIVIRIEEQLCKIIVKYIASANNKLYEDDVAIIIDALGLD